MSIPVSPQSLSTTDAQSADLRQVIEQLSALETRALVAAVIGGALGGKVAVVSSFGAELAVVLALVASIDRGFPVIFLDTGKHFPETLAYRDTLVAHLGLTDVRTVPPLTEDLAQFDPGGGLWSTAPDHCCFLRKVMPLDRALVGFSGWITGRKRYHGDLRATLPRIEAIDGRIKVNPLADLVGRGDPGAVLLNAVCRRTLWRRKGMPRLVAHLARGQSQPDRPPAPAAGKA